MEHADQTSRHVLEGRPEAPRTLLGLVNAGQYELAAYRLVYGLLWESLGGSSDGAYDVAPPGGRRRGATRRHGT